MLGVLGHIPDSDNPQAIVKRLLDPLPSGSYLAINDGTTIDPAYVEAVLAFNQNPASATSYYPRSPEAHRPFLRRPRTGRTRRGVHLAVATRTQHLGRARRSLRLRRGRPQALTSHAPGGAYRQANIGPFHAIWHIRKTASRAMHCASSWSVFGRPTSCRACAGLTSWTPSPGRALRNSLTGTRGCGHQSVTHSMAATSWLIMSSSAVRLRAAIRVPASYSLSVRHRAGARHSGSSANVPTQAWANRAS